MTDDRMDSVARDEFDARIARYLRWEGEQLRGAPAGEEIAQLVSRAVVRRRWAANPVLVWAALVMALLVVASAIIVAGNQLDKLATIAPSPSSQASPLDSSRPTPGPTREPITGAGLCRDGRIAIEAPPSIVDWPPGSDEMWPGPADGRIAMALEGSPTGAIMVTDNSPDLVRTVASFTGDMQSDASVQVLSWSPSGDSLLVLAQYSHFSDPDQNCGNYFVVRSDGSAVQRLTDYGPGESPDGAVFSPSGSAVAWTLGRVIHIASLSGEFRAFPLACLAIVGELRWTSDERQMLLQCEEGGILTIDLASGEGRWLPLHPRPLDARWSSNDQAIVVAVGDDVPGLAGGPLSILDVDPATMSFTTRVRSDVATEWVLGRPSLSPDTRWLLVQGGGDIADLPYFPTYLVNTATGSTTKLPFPVMADMTNLDDFNRRRPGVTWLPGNERVLVADEGTLYEVDFRNRSRAAVGTVPAEDFAWTATQ